MLHSKKKPDTSKEKISSDLFCDGYEGTNFSPTGMRLAINALKEYSPSMKKYAFNCFVFHDQQLKIFKDFLKQLQKNKHHFPDTRIQYLFLAEETFYNHWTLTDLEIKNGKLSFYFTDASDMRCGLQYQLIDINKFCPDADISCTMLHMQRDSENCGNFALAQAVVFAKMPNLHDQLKLMPADNYFNKLLDVTDFLSSPGNLYFWKNAIKKLKSINRDTLLTFPGFGSLIKHTQEINCALNVCPINFESDLLISHANYLKLYIDQESKQLFYKYRSEDSKEDNHDPKQPDERYSSSNYKIKRLGLNEPPTMLLKCGSLTPTETDTLFSCVLKVTSEFGEEKHMADTLNTITLRNNQSLYDFLKTHMSKVGDASTCSLIYFKNDTILTKREKTKQMITQLIKDKSIEELDKMINPKVVIAFLDAIQVQNRKALVESHSNLTIKLPLSCDFDESSPSNSKRVQKSPLAANSLLKQLSDTSATVGSITLGKNMLTI